MKKEIIKNTKPKIVDIFCGCGGISLGFKEAGFSVLAGVDNWKEAITTYKNNFPEAKAIHMEVSDTNLKEIIKILGIEKGELDVLVGGPPCQGFSLAGDRKKDDPRNNLVYSFINLVKEIRPKAFVMENVLGILSMNNGKVREDIKNRFTSLGYNIDAKSLYAHYFGVPQIRRRVFFVGNRLGKIARLPEQTHFDPSQIKNSNKFVTVGDAINDLPLLENDFGQEVSDYRNNAKTKYQKEMRKFSRKIYNHVVSNHTENTKKVIALVPEGGNWKDLPKKYQNIRSYSNTWKRLSSKKPSVTIDCGHRHHFHYKANRVPTVRESARIQSFPDRFRFYGSKTSQFAQVGNAVPPTMARSVAREIKKIL